MKNSTVNRLMFGTLFPVLGLYGWIVFYRLFQAFSSKNSDGLFAYWAVELSIFLGISFMVLTLFQERPR